MIALTIALAIGELALRAAVTLPLRRVLPEIRYDRHPVRHFTLRPNQTAYSFGATASVDGQGFRTNGRAGGSAGGARVLALGDSFTFGMGVRDEETWPARLEARLQTLLDRPIAVTNAGTISYGVYQEMDLLRTAGLAIAPDIVVHGLYWNDFMNDGPPSATAPNVVTSRGYLAWDLPDDTRGALPKLLSWASTRSALLFALRQTILQSGLLPREQSAYGDAYARFLERGLTDEEWQPIERFYRELLALGRERGFRIFVVVMPVNDIVALPAASSHPYPRAARARLTALGVPHLDAFSLWERGKADVDDMFLPQGSDSHLNAKGYGALAMAVADALGSNPELRATLLAQSSASSTH